MFMICSALNDGYGIQTEDLMATRKRKLNDLSRVLYHHQWNSLDEWTQSISDLADLNDDEIQDLERLAVRDRDSRYQD
jgi:hypothetical protein